MSLDSGEKRGEAAPHNLSEAMGKLKPKALSWYVRSAFLTREEPVGVGRPCDVKDDASLPRKAAVFPVTRHALFSSRGAGGPH